MVVENKKSILCLKYLLLNTCKYIIMTYGLFRKCRKNTLKIYIIKIRAIPVPPFKFKHYISFACP